ncbi:MAG: hypothetical protein K2K25_06515 [Muribaculaceae bacterium]|nr:hypothetical protein [Muribaculaceae bacterium]
MKEKHRIFILSAIISIAALSFHAKENSDHIARDGDRLHPGIANPRSLILSVNDTSRTVLLGPSAVSFDSNLDACSYIDSDTISYVQSATKHRFIFRSDTLSYLGFENRATYFRLDSPAIVAVFPLRDGNATKDEWTGSLLHYGTMMLKHVKGESKGAVQGKWTLTDGTDTLRNAVKVRWILDMAYADPDSITCAVSDSIDSRSISDMQVDAKAILSERLLTERSLWFSEDARYPVLTDSRVSRVISTDTGMRADTVPLSLLAMHYPASYQHSDTGEEFPAPKPDDGNRGYGYGNQDTGTSLSVGDMAVSGEFVTVTLCSNSGPVTATLTLFTDSGIRLTEPREVTVGPVAQEIRIEIPAGWRGVLLLRVEAGEESYTRKSIL